jgi:dihydropteroate synthase
MQILNCGKKILDLSKPAVMAIMNITPDSFYSGSRYSSTQQAIDSVSIMIADGADIIDVGGMSSRPGAAEISENEEADRVIQVIEAIHRHFPDILISVDTYRAAIAKKAINAGASIVNDITAGNADPAMIDTVASLHIPYIMMHMRGTPRTMLLRTQYQDIVTEVLKYFSERIKIAMKAGIRDIIIDPGFGFAKSQDGNYKLLQHLSSFKIFDLPVLAGLSRKSMIYQPLKTDAEHAVNGTTALNMAALERGASILRVHDVREAVQTVRLYQLLNVAQEHQNDRSGCD